MTAHPQLIYNAVCICDRSVLYTADELYTCELTDRITYFHKEEAIVDKKLFGSLSEPLKEKLRNCKSKAEMRQIITDAGIQELSDDALECVSGGVYAPTFSDCTSFVTCRSATDTRGDRCTAYRFL